MAIREREVRFGTDGIGRRPGAYEEAPIGELFRELSEDAATLVRQEVALAKAELRQTARQVARDGAKLGIAAGLAWFGAMAAVAFLILALGALLDSYWLSALIVAVALLGTAAVMAKNAKAELEHADLRPNETIDTLRADAEWAKRETHEFTREMRGSRPR